MKRILSVFMLCGVLLCSNVAFVNNSAEALTKKKAKQTVLKLQKAKLTRSKRSKSKRKFFNFDNYGDLLSTSDLVSPVPQRGETATRQGPPARVEYSCFSGTVPCGDGSCGYSSGTEISVRVSAGRVIPDDGLCCSMNSKEIDGKYYCE